MLHQLDAWHAQQQEWRIAAVLRIEITLEGCADHAVGTAVLD